MHDHQQSGGDRRSLQKRVAGVLTEPTHRPNELHEKPNLFILSYIKEIKNHEGKTNYRP